jgi:hypothetical protein
MQELADDTWKRIDEFLVFYAEIKKIVIKADFVMKNKVSIWLR